MDSASVSGKMQSVIEMVISDSASIRTGRANPGLIENLIVAVYGGQQKLKINELATILIPDSQTIVIDPWDKSIIGEVKKGIESANVGLTPNIDGEIIRIILPPMTFEDREKYVKLLGLKIENAKVMIRQIRGDIMHELKKSFETKEISEDERFVQEKKLQDLTDKYTRSIDEMGERKKQELMQI